MALLIVDDEEGNRDMLFHSLRQHGFEVLLAEDGPQAMDSIRKQTPDMVLLDVRMPGMSGMQVLRAIREGYTASQLPVIMVTAEAHSGSIVEALQAGANDYITKPVDLPVALARIRTQLSQKALSAALRDSEERYARSARGANDGLWDWDLKADEIYYSARWKAMLGYQDGDIGNRPGEWLGRVHPDDLPGFQAAVAAHCRRETPQLDCEQRVRGKDGAYRWMLSRGLAIWNEAGAAVRIAGSLTDITAAKVADPLTGLPNRLLFTDRLERRIEIYRRRPASEFAILLLDVDRFKNVNDSLGYPAGDLLLKALAKRLRDGLRAADTVARLQEDCGVARLDGDEFAVLLGQVRQPGDAVSVAERIGAEMRAPFMLNGHEVFVTASIGIAGSHDKCQHAEDLMRDADTALHCAKAGRTRFEIFNANMRRRAVSRLQVETDLRRALERNELRLHYQQIVNLRTGAIAGFEALVRWQHPLRGLVFPAEFIPMAEETGLIVPAGHWILEQACRDAQRWLATPAGAALSDRGGLTLHVNLSPVQLAEPDAIDEMERILRHSWPGGRGFGLSFEITEGTIMRNSDTVSKLLDRLRDLHIGLDIDDFGTGYSSLSQLQHLPVQTLKIDRAFVSRIGLDGDSLEIIRTIVALAHNLGLDVVAEGVETAPQLAELKALDCEYAQGYHFGKPTDREMAWSLIGQDGSGVNPVSADGGHQPGAGVILSSDSWLPDSASYSLEDS